MCWKVIALLHSNVSIPADRPAIVAGQHTTAQAAAADMRQGDIGKFTDEGYQVIWRPIPGTSQELALSCPADQILYHGSRGPGKTDTQLMRFARNVGKGYGKYWTGIIFDREYKSLGDLIKKSQHWFRQIWTEKEAKFLASNSQLKWVWATGEELLFRTIDDPEDYWKYHGQEYPFMGWNELTQWPTSECYDIMQSCNRTSWTQLKDSPRDAAGNFTLPPIPLENFSTTNSFGIGHYWVKERFITPGENGQIVTHTTSVIDPATKEEVDVELTQCAIFGMWVENIHLPAKYIAKIKNEKDKNRRLSWFTGSWDIVAGGAFDDVWDKNVHVVQRFRLPSNWRILDRSYDDGSSSPFSVGWWVEANGETVQVPRPTTPDQPYGANGFDDWTPQAGSLILVHEWYGSQGSYGDNKGIKLGSTRIGEGIAERDLQLLMGGWIPVLPGEGPADGKIFDKKDEASPAQNMAKAGITWERADQTKGSRVRGLEIVRDRFMAATANEGPGLYFMHHCHAAITTIPILPRDPKNADDVDTKAVDHAFDMVKYRCQKGNLDFVDGLTMSFPR